MLIRVFNYNTLERVHMFEAHADYIRCIAVHPSQPYILTCSGKKELHTLTQAQKVSIMSNLCASLNCKQKSIAYSSPCFMCVFSDDMLIKLWDWDRKWSCSQVFEGHTHYVMEIVINPKDNNQFASASLDRTIKVTDAHTLMQMFVRTHKS